MAILSIGFSCFDQFFFLNEWPQENTKNFCHDFIESGGGPAANAAWLLGLWGEDVYYSVPGVQGGHGCLNEPRVCLEY